MRTPRLMSTLIRPRVDNFRQVYVRIGAMESDTSVRQYDLPAGIQGGGVRTLRNPYSTISSSGSEGGLGFFLLALALVSPFPASTSAVHTLIGVRADWVHVACISNSPSPRATLLSYKLRADLESTTQQFYSKYRPSPKVVQAYRPVRVANTFNPLESQPGAKRLCRVDCAE
eukprot:6646114-Pyramimonas_sp.AAC.3